MLRNDTQIAAATEIFEAIGIKGALADVAKRHLRTTPEYAQAKREGRARAWLNTEAASWAENAYDHLTNWDLDPYAGS